MNYWHSTILFQVVAVDLNISDILKWKWYKRLIVKIAKYNKTHSFFLQYVLLNQVMDREGFGKCSNVGACEVECPKEISTDNIAALNRYYLGAMLGS